MTTTSSHKKNHSLPLALILVAAMALIACGGPPQDALDAANKALLDSAWAEECAADTYRAAKKMMAEAQEASDAGEYEEARRKADAAVRLTEQARKDAELNRDECEKRNANRDEIAKKLDEGKVTVVNNTDAKLETVYFDFNESILTQSAQGTITQNGNWLLDNQTVKVRIEGHTDERGSTEYNLALSQRRAQAVKRYLTTLGVQGDRMAVVPYGEEKPASDGDSEDSHANNRRAEFVKQ